MTVNSEDRTIIDHGETVVTSRPPERQAVEVKAMRFVLAIGLTLVILGMVASYVTA